MYYKNNAYFYYSLFTYHLYKNPKNASRKFVMSLSSCKICKNAWSWTEHIVEFFLKLL